MKSFDRDKALAIVDGDEQLLGEIIDLFRRQNLKLLAEMDRAIRTAEPGLLRRAAHTLKGAASNVAAKQICESAGRLESMAAQGNLQDAAAELQRLKADLEQIDRELTESAGNAQ